jgi:hypothetical protein
MSTITVHATYCEEHAETHYLDELDRCHGESLRSIESRGYTWARHIGGGWYKLHERYPQTLPLDWQMLADAHSNIQEAEVDF